MSHPKGAILSLILEIHLFIYHTYEAHEIFLLQTQQGIKSLLEPDIKAMFVCFLRSTPEPEFMKC